MQYFFYYIDLLLMFSCYPDNFLTRSIYIYIVVIIFVLIKNLLASLEMFQMQLSLSLHIV